ncbi:MAG: hypothetical protein WKF68_06525 [Daejeonella sp.]
MNFIILVISLWLFDEPGYLSQKFQSRQLVIVTTSGWNSINGKMTAYDWKDNQWVPVLKNIPIVTGRSGLAWGKGLHDPALNKGKLKKEGDGNAPAGIFYLNGAFRVPGHIF